MSTPTIIIGWIDLSLQKGFLFKSYFLFFLINISILTKASLLFIKIILWVDPSQQPAEVTPTRLHRFSTHTQVLTLHAQGSEETLSRQMKQHSNTCVAWNGSPTVRKSKCHVERIEAMGMEVDRLKMRTITLDVEQYTGRVMKKSKVELQRLNYNSYSWLNESSLWVCLLPKPF